MTRAMRQTMTEISFGMNGQGKLAKLDKAHKKVDA